MKKTVYLLITASLLIICLAACNTKSTDNISTADMVGTENTEVSTISTNELQEEYNRLKAEYDNITNIYDDSLKSSVNTYCEKYLSYSGTATDNIDKVKDIITDDYYNELLSQSGHQKSDEEYEQATGLVSLYYGDNSSLSDNIDVVALCKQTVIFDGEVTTADTAYIFGMNYSDGKWKIDSVDAAITNTN